MPLSLAIAGQPEHWLGLQAVERFGSNLPFLLKILAVDRPLSLQAHPDAAAAAAGFAREEDEGASNRIYVDARHKPELLVALEPFWALRGLRPALEIRQHLDWPATVLADSLEALTADSGTRLDGFVSQLLRMEADDWKRTVDRMQPRLARVLPDDRSDPWYWVGALLEHHPGDPACLSPLFLHLVRLEPGQALFQPPGILHCYLRGGGVEVMASSDNVLRGGLTSKRTDIDELLGVCELVPEPKAIVESVSHRVGVHTWETPADEFRLVSLATDGEAVAWRTEGTITLAVCTAGQGRLSTGQESLVLSGGDAAAIAAVAEEVTLKATRPTTVFCATVPRREG